LRPMIPPPKSILGIAILFTALLATSLLHPLSALAQTGSASLSGRVTDQSNAVVPDVEVEIKNVDTNVTRLTKTNGDGIYSFPALPPGNYLMNVRKQQFRTVSVTGVQLHTQDSLARNFVLEVGSSAESVTVNASASSMESDSPAVSMTVTREFVEDMPLNGRSFQDLIQLAPGTVSSGGSIGSPYGYYSIDGQRTDGNNFTVDGVSANLGGVLNTAGGDGGISGSTPSQTALGTTQSLVSIDALQEFKIQTSGYTAEYGRNPGGQVGFTTRSGTNDIHGTLFEYLRNTAFDAKSYQEDYFNQPKAAEHQNDFGGTVGGPLVIPKLYDGKDKTFFFLSYEGLRLLTPAFESEYVPTQAFRNWASPSVQPYLNSVPLPSPNSPGNQDGCTIPDSTGQLTACDALFTHSYSNPSNIDSLSVRLDQNFGQRFHFFLRYADTPSSASTGAESVTRNEISVHTWTAGFTASINSTLLNELRFNYSHDGEGSFETQSAVGGSIPLARDLLIPAVYDGAYAIGDLYASVPSTSLSLNVLLAGSGSVQHQYQVVDSLNWTRGDHNLKFGGDWRRLTPTIAPGGYYSQVTLGELPAFQQGYASSVTILDYAPGRPVFDNISLYAQDHWKISPRLSIDYGVRWEFNPPPGPSNGHYPATLTSSDLATATLAPAGSDPYQTTYDHFAPRFGFAWNAIASAQHALTVRGGFGIFYDTGQQTIGAAYNGGFPFQAIGPTLTNAPFPLSSASLAPPSLNVPLTPPYPFLSELTSPSLTFPYTEQWNLSIDEALNSRNTLTMSYVGNEGKKLLFTGYYQGGGGTPINPDFANGINFTYNGSKSSYNALQVQDRGKIANGLDLVGSFTWAHSLDNISSNFGYGYAPTYGNSDNDLRLVLNLALNYQTPTTGSTRWMRALTHGWVVANRFSTQSGYPLQIYQDECGPLPNGTCQQYFPDLIPGVPIYLHGSAAEVNGNPVPGGWRLNPAAFALVPTNPTTGLPIRQGTLGRNFVRGPGFYALNSAVQRSFPIHERLHLLFRVDAFNILNHPNLDFPDANLPDSTFGQLGTGVRTIGVANQLYAMGAPRSLQFSLKLQF
jgi:Carboxypeptidase regulatory-like domain/TonB dependent receptor/TonB-dependent Receptor Plug Domain